MSSLSQFAPEMERPASVLCAAVPDADALRDKALRALGSLPPFSPILNKLLASLAADDVSFAKLSDLIEKDTVLAGNVLQLVNSALYARRGTINSVRHALSILGMNKLRNAVLGMSVARMWNQVRTPASWSMARFNKHSAATALLSDLLAQRVPVAYPEGAFVAGLLHDVGELLIAIALPAQHQRIHAMHVAAGIPLSECEQKVLGWSHAQLSAQALEVWNIPKPIQQAVRDHGMRAELPSREEIPLGSLVNTADSYVDSIGVSILAAPEGLEGDPALLKQLGLTASQSEAVLAEFRVEYEALLPFFG